MNVSEKERKHNEAVARNEKWATLTFEKQLQHLDEMFGLDQGAAKQRTKILKQIKKRDEKKGKK